MKKRFSNLKVSEGKLNLNLTSEFRPLEDDPSVVFTVEHIRNGEMMAFLDIEGKSIDMPRMFAKKVIKIEGIEIEDADGKTFTPTPKQFVDIPDPDFSAMVMTTCTYILSHSSLEGDEEKN